MQRSVRLTLLSVALLSAFSASADCGLSLMHGRFSVANVPTFRVDNILTTSYTGVATRVRNTSPATELGIECKLGYGFALGASVLGGISADVDRDAYFTGFNRYGVNIPPTHLFHINEEATARAVRLSVAWYADYFGNTVSPYGRLGVARYEAKHHADIPLGSGVSIAYDKTYKKTAPYIGLGLLFFPESPLSVRVEYQLMALKPHKAHVFMIGATWRFAAF